MIQQTATNALEMTFTCIITKNNIFVYKELNLREIARNQYKLREKFSNDTGPSEERNREATAIPNYATY